MRSPTPQTPATVPAPQAEHDAWFRRPLALRWLGALIIVALGTYAFAPALHGDWVWDDDAEIVQNAAIKDPAALGKIWRGVDLPDYFPLKTTVQWLQWRAWQHATFGYHVTNLGLHLISALLLWRLLRRLGLLCGWVGGVLFALHPITTESVAWIAELKNVLSLPPLLLALDRFITFREQARQRDAVLAVMWFAVAMLCKTSVVALPVFLLVYLWWRDDWKVPRSLKVLWPFFFISLALGAVTLWFQATRAIGSWVIPSGGILERLARAGMALGFYLEKCLFPAGLSPLYPRSVVADPALIGALVWAAAVALAWWCWRKRTTWGRHALLGLAWFGLNLAPVLGLIDMAYLHFSWVADHFVYLPLIGLIGLFVAEWERAWRRGAAVRVAATAFLLVLIAGATAATRRQAALYQGDLALWSHLLQHEPGSWYAHNNLATALIRERRFAEALEHADNAIRLQPVYPDARFTKAAALVNLQRLDEARAEASLLRPEGRRVAELHVSLAAALLRANRVAEAIEHYETSLRAEPDWAKAHKEVAVALHIAGRGQEALAHYERGLQLEPDAETHSNYGVALAAVGRVNEAMQHYEQALRLQPGYSEALYNLGIALRLVGRLEQSKAQLEAVLRAQPGRAEAHYNLGETFWQMKRSGEARAEFEEAARLNPSLPEPRARLEEMRRAELRREHD